MKDEMQRPIERIFLANQAVSLSLFPLSVSFIYYE